MAPALHFHQHMFSDGAGFEQLTDAIIECAITVHTAVGPGLLESVCGTCLAIELRAQGFRVETERPLSMTYRGQTLSQTFRLDMIVEELIVIEVKSVKKLLPVHEAQSSLT